MTKSLDTMAIRKIRMPDGRVLRVEDAPLDANIEVRREDIQKAVIGDPLACAIARAGHRELGTVTVIIWKTRGLFETSDGRVVRYLFPLATQRFIEAVDNGLPVEPSVLKLLAPSTSRRIGAVKGLAGLTKKQGRKTGERQPRVWRGPRGNFSLRGETVTVELSQAAPTVSAL